MTKRFAVDWAQKKDYQLCNLKTEKLASLPAKPEAWLKFFKKNPDSEYFLEEGGAEPFKLYAFKLGSKVFTIPGIEAKRWRDELGVKKTTDQADAFYLARLAKTRSNSFRPFEKMDILTARIYIFFKSREKTESDMVQAKNRLWALKHQFEMFEPSPSEQKILEDSEKLIELLGKKFKDETRVLEKMVKEHPLWSNYLSEFKGVGPACAGGIIASIKRIERFGEDKAAKYRLRSFAGMKKKKGDQNFNHTLKSALYIFAEHVERNQNPEWRRLYDQCKEFYKNRHPDWTKGHIRNWTLRWIETKFLDQLWEFWSGNGHKTVQKENGISKLL